MFRRKSELDYEYSFLYKLKRKTNDEGKNEAWAIYLPRVILLSVLAVINTAALFVFVLFIPNYLGRNFSWVSIGIAFLVIIPFMFHNNKKSHINFLCQIRLDGFSNLSTFVNILTLMMGYVLLIRLTMLSMTMDVVNKQAGGWLKEILSIGSVNKAVAETNIYWIAACLVCVLIVWGATRDYCPSSSYKTRRDREQAKRDLKDRGLESIVRRWMNDPLQSGYRAMKRQAPGRRDRFHTSPYLLFSMSGLKLECDMREFDSIAYRIFEEMQLKDLEKGNNQNSFRETQAKAKQESQDSFQDTHTDQQVNVNKDDSYISLRAKGQYGSAGGIKVLGGPLPNRGLVGDVEVRFDEELPKYVRQTGQTRYYQTSGNVQVFYKDAEQSTKHVFLGKTVDVYYKN